MTVYVAEIKGRGVAAFHADNGAEVRQARPGEEAKPRRFAGAISSGKTIHGSLFSSHSPILTDARGDEGGQGSGKAVVVCSAGGRAHRQSIGIDDCMNLARETTARPTH